MMERVIPSSIAAAILAGGRARRFGGRDKSRLVVGDRPIIVRQIEVLQRIAARVVVIANEPERFADLGLPVVADLIPNAGALGGIYTALRSADGDRVIVVACDMPHLNEALLRRLAELAATGDGAWVRGARGPEPLLACYATAAADRIGHALDRGEFRAGDLDRILDMKEIDERELATFGEPADLLRNVNTPEDYGAL
jgi:molybdopterin-guanine dinucleotide biosynthesis protein A